MTNRSQDPTSSMSATTLEAPPPRGLSRLRRNGVNQSSTSIVSSSSTGNDSGDNGNGRGGGGLRASLSNAMDKVRKSVDDRRESNSDASPQRRLSTMFKRKKRDDNGSRRSSQQTGDANRLSQVTTDESHPDPAPSSRRSSLLTDGGDERCVSTATRSHLRASRHFVALPSSQHFEHNDHGSLRRGAWRASLQLRSFRQMLMSRLRILAIVHPFINNNTSQASRSAQSALLAFHMRVIVPNH